MKNLIKEIEKIIKLVKENNIKNNVDIIATLLALKIKIEQFEDLEEQLGCPLDVVFKAIEDGICIKLGDEYEQCNVEGWRIGVLFEEQCFIIHEMLFRTKLPLKDYGTTWWLNESEVKGNEKD